MAVSGTPGRGSVHVVEGVPALAGGSVTVVNGVRVCSKISSLNIYHSRFSLSPTMVDPMWLLYPTILLPLCHRWLITACFYNSHLLSEDVFSVVLPS